jgi:hypothetical protein
MTYSAYVCEVAEHEGALVYVGSGTLSRARRTEFTGRRWECCTQTRAQAEILALTVLELTPSIEGRSKRSIRRASDVFRLTLFALYSPMDTQSALVGVLPSSELQLPSYPEDPYPFGLYGSGFGIEQLRRQILDNVRLGLLLDRLTSVEPGVTHAEVIAIERAHRAHIGNGDKDQKH